MTIGVYRIDLNDKFYIGSSSRSIEGRWNEHKSDLRRGCHANRHLQNAYNKYGAGSLLFSILKVVDIPKDVIKTEQGYIDELKPEYNILQIAGSCLGMKFPNRSAEWCEKISRGNMGHVHTEEHKQKIRDALTGLVRGPQPQDQIERRRSKQIGKKLGPCSEERKIKIGIANTGKTRTEEVKQKIREIRLGSNASEETRQKMSESRMGHNVSEETREKLRLANVGLKGSEQKRQKCRENNLGKKHSEETKRKMSEAHQLRNAMRVEVMNANKS